MVDFWSPAYPATFPAPTLCSACPVPAASSATPRSPFLPASPFPTLDLDPVVRRHLPWLASVELLTPVASSAYLTRSLIMLPPLLLVPEQP